MNIYVELATTCRSTGKDRLLLAAVSFRHPGNGPVNDDNHHTTRTNLPVSYQLPCASIKFYNVYNHRVRKYGEMMEFFTMMLCRDKGMHIGCVGLDRHVWCINSHTCFIYHRKLPLRFSFCRPNSLFISYFIYYVYTFSVLGSQPVDIADQDISGYIEQSLSRHCKYSYNNNVKPDLPLNFFKCKGGQANEIS